MLRKIPYTFAAEARLTATGLGVLETPTDMAIDCDIAPEVPVMVTVAGEVVMAALEDAVNVSTLPTNVAVTPLGNPEAASVTDPVNEPTGVIVICVLADEPGTMLSAGWKVDKL